jgi:hypothetical protein
MVRLSQVSTAVRKDFSMYATLPFRRLLAVLLWPFGAIFVGLILLNGTPSNPTAWVRAVSSAISIWAITLIVLGGSSKPWSPWRLIWRAVPALNEIAFPDLNGVWKGTTASNWAVISMLKDHATGVGGLGLNQLELVPLKEDGVTIQIRASLFRLSVLAELHGTGAQSQSITARVLKDEVREAFDLSYIYRQNTPEAGLLDEASHLGAAVLQFDRSAGRLSGEYWTKRSWRLGLNTAGRIEIVRRSS